MSAVRWLSRVLARRGNDGLTRRERRHYARAWAAGAGRKPDLEQFNTEATS